MTRAANLGDRKQRVQLYDVPPSAPDSYGQTTDVGTLVGTFWAYIRNLSGREMMRAQQVQILATHRVELGWLGSAIPAAAHNPNRLILPSMYLIVVSTGARLDVIFADDVEMRHELWVLTCQEKVIS